jgi:hypothetical protein
MFFFYTLKQGSPTFLLVDRIGFGIAGGAPNLKRVV